MAEHLAEWIAGLGPQIANHLWQSTAFAAGAWLLTLALRRNQARVRYAVWLAASIKFLIPFSLLVAAGNLLPHPKQAVAPVVYSAMDVVEEPFAELPQFIAPPVHVPTLRERAEAALPVALFAVWLLGAGVVVFRWARSWRVVRRTLREAEVAEEGREWEILQRVGAIPLGLSKERMEPGIFGIWRPVLVWPRELTARLEDEHIEVILAHELAHVRRKDNLWAAVHMFVETIFWFHPVVWWMERRMVAEREQACDEAVVYSTTPLISLRSMNGPPDRSVDPQSYAETYAEALLKTCRFCVESPLVCVAGVTGADLKQRVMEIVTGRALLQMSWAKRALISAAAVCVVAAPVVLGQAKAAQRLMQAAINAAPKPVQAVAKVMMADAVTASSSEVADAAQPASDNAAPADADMSLGPAFEVATIRPANRNDGRRSFGTTVDASGKFVGSAVTLSSLVWYAYANQPLKARVSGGPKWADSDFFDINAKIDAAYMDGWDKLTSEQRMARIRPMVRTLLVQRFRLKLHTEILPTPVYALVQAKGGAKMKEVPTPEAVDYDPEAFARWKNEHPNEPRPGIISCGPGPNCIGTAVRISSAIGQIQGSAHADRMVVDQTGLNGYYNFTMPMPRRDDEDAMQEISDALGLKFEPRTMPIKTYVIDSAEKPSVDGAEVGSVPLLDYMAANASDEAGLSTTYRKWLDGDVHWLITPQERAEFLKLTTDKDRTAFVDAFWEKRNAPGAAKDAYKAEIYARIADANDRFTVTGKPGWATDRGRAYIVYGKPDSIAVHRSEGDEVWLYSHLGGAGASASLKFVRKDGDYQLEGAWPQFSRYATFTDSLVAPAGVAVRQTQIAFSVVSLRPSPADAHSMSPPHGTAEDFEASMANVESMIGFAYDIPTVIGMSMDPAHFYLPHASNLIGGPEWVRSAQYDLKAKLDGAELETWSKLPKVQQKEQLRQMMRAMLAERFHMVAHWEKRDMPVYALVVSKGGSKLSASKGPPPGLNDGSDPAKPFDISKPYVTRWGGGDQGWIRGRDVTIDGLMPELWMQKELDSRKVLDQTGLTGRYDIDLRWASVNDPKNPDGPSLFTAIQEQLGLKLEPTKAPMDVLVVDHIERPTEN